ncbi:acyl-CoA hydrolase 2-like [Arachis stenosperma]|uniref:acyl-CoA hydrolase 2-like n=1 Tax=Arachis stenosperma TaxID=217475 RepID=UPI0025ACE102|nr:acyl-CoA hydrolase 2-like [Arachis stenosperma]
MEELPERCLTDPRLPKTYRNKIATTKFTPWPIEIRFCELTTSTNQTKSPPSLNFWFRAKGKLSDDQALHRCVVAFASDLIFLQVALNPHRKQGMKASSVSLDHAEKVDVRIVDDDVTIKLFQRKKINCLLSVAKFLDELQLELHHVAGGHVGKYYSFLFNSKIIDGSSVYASVIDVMDTQYAAAVPHTGSY